MKNYLILFSILILAAFVRFYKFSDKVVYGPEQGISLISAVSNLEKPSLLGIPYLLRQTSEGLRIFTSPVFGYTLVPLIWSTNYDPIKITIFFSLLNIFTGILIFLFVKKILNKEAAIFSGIIFLFNSKMIYHSMFIWTSNYMPLVGILSLIFLYMLSKSKKVIYVFLLGLLSGIGFGLQYFYVFGVALIFLLIFYFSKRRLADTIAYVFGFLAGELPTVVFDLKHNFYHLRTLTSYFVEILQNSGESQIAYYHYLAFYPLAAILFGVIIWLLFRKNKPLALLILALYLMFNFKILSGMPDGLKAKDILTSAKVISSENPKNFNVTILGNFDNRGYTLRYPLENIYQVKVDPVENYADTQTIYVLARKDYNFNIPDIWEIRTFVPFNVIEVESINNIWALYKLVKS